MRVLEFRAWHQPTQRLFYVHSFSPTRVYELLEKSDDAEFPWDVYTEAFRREECVISQYTGRVDRTGKKMFEGDITHYINEDHENPENNTESFYKVVFKDGAFGLAPLNDDDDEFFNMADYRNKGDLMVDELIVGDIWHIQDLPALDRFPPMAAAVKLNLSKQGICEAHKALTEWQTFLTAIARDNQRASNPANYQAHFTWLSTLQGIPANQKNRLFTEMREVAKSNGIVWDGTDRKFFRSIALTQGHQAA